MYKHVFASVYKCVCLCVQTRVITRALYLASDQYCIYTYMYDYKANFPSTCVYGLYLYVCVQQYKLQGSCIMYTHYITP